MTQISPEKQIDPQTYVTNLERLLSSEEEADFASPETESKTKKGTNHDSDRDIVGLGEIKRDRQ